MKKLIMILPAQLSDDGRLSIKHQKSLSIIIGSLRDNYEITLFVRNQMDKCIPDWNASGTYIVYDGSLPKDTISDYPSRFQISYNRWTGHTRADSEYDCLIAWDGCSPWCLATAFTCITAKRRILWLHDDPELYLMDTEHQFYTGLCDWFDAIAVPDENTRQSLLNICGGGVVGQKAVVMNLPVDVSWYWEQSNDIPYWEVRKDEINLLAFSRMSVESEMEQLPYKISQVCKTQPGVHAYLIGDDNRLNRYFQQVAIYDVDSVFTFLGAQKNPYPYIRACDVLIICENERLPEIELAAEIYGTPVVRLEMLHQTKLTKKREFPEETPYHWVDGVKLQKILEGEMNS